MLSAGQFFTCQTGELSLPALERQAADLERMMFDMASKILAHDALLLVLMRGAAAHLISAAVDEASEMLRTLPDRGEGREALRQEGLVALAKIADQRGLRANTMH